MKKLAWIAAATVALALTVVLGSGLLDGQEAYAQAPLDMGIDPDTSGNSCAASPTDCTLGAIEYCVRVDVADGALGDGVADFDIDVFVDDPAGNAPAPTLYDAWVTYEQTKVLPVAMASKIKIPGADISGDEVLPEGAPDGTVTSGWMFLLGAPNVGVNTFIGDGPVNRIEFDVQDAAGNCKASLGGCVANFAFNEPASGYQSLAGAWPSVQVHPVTFSGALWP